VHCSTTDAHGNTATGSFSVTVLSAAQQLSSLAASLAGVGGGSFSSQLTAAELQLASGKNQAACNNVAAFANHVRAQAGKLFTTSEATDLLAAADRIRAVIGC